MAGRWLGAELHMAGAAVEEGAWAADPYTADQRMGRSLEGRGCWRNLPQRGRGLMVEEETKQNKNQSFSLARVLRGNHFSYFVGFKVSPPGVSPPVLML